MKEKNLKVGDTVLIKHRGSIHCIFKIVNIDNPKRIKCNDNKVRTNGVLRTNELAEGWTLQSVYSKTMIENNMIVINPKEYPEYFI